MPLLPSVHTLPLEIIVMIVESSVLTLSDIAALCCIQIFHVPAMEFLYRQFHGRKWNLEGFLRTILGSIWLASQVTEVHLDSVCAPTASEPTAETLELFTTRLHHLHMTAQDRQQWLQYIRQGHGDALATLLLASLPNLKELHILTNNQYLYAEKHMLWFLVRFKPFQNLPIARPSLAKTTSFVSIQDITIQSIPSMPYSMYDLGGVFRLPGLQKLHIWDVFEPRRRGRPYQECFMPSTSNISSLSFTAANLSIKGLGRMVLCCKKLEKFAYNRPQISQASDRHGSLLGLLFTFSDTITSLEFHDYTSWMHIPSAPIISLTGFWKLQEFRGDAITLFSHQVNSEDESDSLLPLTHILPRSVLKLELHNVWDTLLSYLTNQEGSLGDVHLSYASRQFPLLKWVSLHQPQLLQESSDATVAPYTTLCPS
jgi:hypothetical protein